MDSVETIFIYLIYFFKYQIRLKPILELKSERRNSKIDI